MPVSASESETDSVTEGEVEGEGEAPAFFPVPKNTVVEDFMNAVSIAILVRVGTKPQNRPADGALPEFAFLPSLFLSAVRGASFMAAYTGILSAVLSYPYNVGGDTRVLMLLIAVLGLGGLHATSFLRDIFKVHYMHVLVEEARAAKAEVEEGEEAEEEKEKEGEDKKDK